MGHWGLDRTMAKVRTVQRMDKGWSDKIPVDSNSEVELRADAAEFIRVCPCCQKMSQLKPYIHTYRYVTMKYGILENLAMDTIVGLPKTDNGNEHLLVIVDTFSRYVQLIPLPELTASTATRALVKWMNTFGKPFSILTDNATQFQAVYQEVLAHLGIDDRRIHPYSHEENSIVERTNKEVERHLRDIMFHEKVLAKWDEFCPVVERIKNNEVVVSTGISPNELVFGKNVNLDRGVLFPNYETTSNPQRMSDYIRQQTELQTIALQVAMQTQQLTDLRHLQSGEVLPKDEFKIGDYVLVQYESNNHKAPTKLHPRWRGPCRVVNVTVRPQGDIYTVQHLDSTKYEDFHVKLLRAFNYDPNHVDPVHIATTDNQSFLVDRILNHRFTSKRKLRGSMEVQVRWVGYDRPTWEPYANVANVDKFHSYLKDHNLSSFLREGYRDPPAKRNRTN